MAKWLITLPITGSGYFIIWYHTNIWVSVGVFLMIWGEIIFEELCKEEKNA